jgi:myo-inositol 2-dehydrogenase/D-chiro-inositol 1-dehydrogenase
MPRRRFLGSATATSLTILAASSVRSVAADSSANSRVELGLIGCGQRGNWIAPLFGEESRCKIVAVHDYFRDRVDALGEKIGVGASRRYTGLEGYKELLDSKVDAVVIESPPYFHPEQAVAALNMDKHVYLAKPVSVDVAGALAIAQAAETLDDEFTCLVDFQTRADEFYQGAAQKLHEGLIGEPFMAQMFYMAGRLDPQANPKDRSATARLRNWVFDKALSGDIIVEQNVHVIDVCNWMLRGHPIKAVGSGGRKARTDVGDCWDHFSVTYTYRDDVVASFCSKQAGYGFDDLCVRIFGTEGTLESHYGGKVHLRGRRGAYAGGETKQIYKSGVQANIKRFVDSIVNNKPINNARESANSTLAAILGRMAAYEQTNVTWDEMLRSNQKLDAKLNLPPDGTAWKG